MIGLICAMPEEAARLREAMRDARVERRGRREFVIGRLFERETALCASRCGKVAAGATMAAMIERYHATPFILTGAAGALADSLSVGDIVLADTLIQHDLDASALPRFTKFEVPLLGASRFRADPTLTALAEAAAREFVERDLEADVPPRLRAEFGIARPRVVRGTIASGDRFIASEAERQALLRELPDVLCVEMEGAAVAQVAYEYDVPFAVIRTISDIANHSAPIAFERFLQIVAHVTYGVVQRLLHRLPDA